MYYDGTDLSGHYITFAKPIYDHAGNLVCVCGADMTIDWLRVELADIDNANKRNPLLNLGLYRADSFFSVVLKSDGKCIANPIDKIVPMTDKGVIRDLANSKGGFIDMKFRGEPATAWTCRKM